MASEQQIEANKMNAQLSTGPKTAEGIAVSKLNAVKHGLLSKEILLDGEEEQNLIELTKRLRQELNPTTELEMILVDRITANVWRLKRAMRIEQELIENERKDEFMGTVKIRNLGNVFSIDSANHDTYGKFIRYETSIERGFYKALHELQRIQAVRKGQKIPAPLAIDIDISKEE